MRVFYNDFEPSSVRWLDNLQRANKIPTGLVSGRSIADLESWELAGYDQCHFFAGIGGWPLAFQLAGYPDLRAWTGSCPCQPFSSAGKQQGESDARHLWPVFRDRIADCLPPIVFGEQVASKLGREWLSRVRADLEALGYAFGSADLCAASVGAPHIRQRLYWGAYRLADASGAARLRTERRSDTGSDTRGGSTILHSACGLANTNSTDENRGASGGEQSIHNEDIGSGRMAQPEEQQRNRSRAEGDWRAESSDSSSACRLGDDDDARLEGRRIPAECTDQLPARSPSLAFWRDFDVIPCSDGKTRRVEPGTFPLAHGIPKRMDKLRGYGNAIVPELAAVFIRSFMEAVNIEPIR